MSANAGRVMNTPAVIPMIVVIAKPWNSPAPALNKGSKATTVVRYAVMTTKIALLILCLIFESFPVLASSTIIICWSTPVPIVASIPAMEGRSRFHLIKDAIPKIIKTSENAVSNNAKDIFSLRYLAKIKIATKNIDIAPARRIA